MKNRAKASDVDDESKKNFLQAMDVVIQGLQTGVWGIVSGYVEHPLVAASIMEGAVRLYLNALAIYHDDATCQRFARRMTDILEPFAEGAINVSDEEWFNSMTPPLLEQLTKTT